MTYMSSTSYSTIDSVVGCNRGCSPCNSCGSGYQSGAIQHSIAAPSYGSIETIIDRPTYTIDMDSQQVEIIPAYVGTIKEKKQIKPYSGSLEKSYSTNPQVTITTKGDVSSGLLRKNRPYVQFVKDAEQIKDYITETFKQLTGEEFPDDIVVSVVSESELKKIHQDMGGVWMPGIMGFAINKKRQGETSQIFVKQNDLDALMLTIGHEIGHVLTLRLDHAQDEEAKAFAFELAWMKAIIDNNIADLQYSFNPVFNPANNGLHDIAFNFVKKLVMQGKKAIDVYFDLVKRAVRLNTTIGG